MGCLSAFANNSIRPLQCTARGREMQHDQTVATVEVECVKSALQEGNVCFAGGHQLDNLQRCCPHPWR